MSVLGIPNIKIGCLFQSKNCSDRFSISAGMNFVLVDPYSISFAVAQFKKDIRLPVPLVIFIIGLSILTNACCWFLSVLIGDSCVYQIFCYFVSPSNPDVSNLCSLVDFQ